MFGSDRSRVGPSQSLLELGDVLLESLLLVLGRRRASGGLLLWRAHDGDAFLCAIFVVGFVLYVQEWHASNFTIYAAVPRKDVSRVEPVSRWVGLPSSTDRPIESRPWARTKAIQVESAVQRVEAERRQQ